MRSSPVPEALGRSRIIGAIIALGSVFAWGCQGSVTASAPVDSGSSDGVLPACTWPASLDPTAAGNGQCTAARTLLRCSGGDSGVQEGCISNDPAQCPSGGVSVPGVSFTCHDQCAPTDYGVVCGGIGPSAQPPATPPSGCLSMGVTPGGTEYYCCPCSGLSGGSEGGPGLSSDAGPTPDAFVLASVGPGTGSISVCGYQSDQTFVAIGTPLDPKPATVTSGELQPGAQGGTVSLVCNVDQGGGGFMIKINAEIGGQNGGSVTIVGNVDANGGTSIYGGFTSAQNGTFIDPNCTITFTYNTQPVPVGGSPVAAGRIWGHIDCPNAIESGTSEIAADGAATERTCDAHADFLFENCQ
jgi:hypothetical protein